MRFGALMVVTKITGFWDVTPLDLVNHHISEEPAVSIFRVDKLGLLCYPEDGGSRFL
jgi:hypothetical protein